MRRSVLPVIALLVVTSAPAGAATIHFNTDPFIGSTALTTPGRQIVGGEPSIVFDPTNDVFTFDPDVFGVSALNFINSTAAGLPASGVNMIVLREFGPPMAAGIAHNLIAAALTVDGPGFFVYFNTGLDMPRLVYAVNLNDNTFDLAVLARLTNLTGNQAAMATFTEDNFALAPEPSLVILLAAGAGAAWGRRRMVRRRNVG
jgi:hypothetical protein